MPTIYQIRTEFATQYGEFAEWTHWITADTQPHAAAAMQAYQTSLNSATAWKALFPSSIVMLGVVASGVDEATGTVVSTFAATGSPPLFTGAPASCMPPELALCVSLRSGFASKSENGRYYLPSPIFSALDSNAALTAANCTVVANAMAAAHSAEIASDPSVGLVIYSRKLRAVALVQTINVGNILDVQRRRRNGLAEVRKSVAV